MLAAPGAAFRSEPRQPRHSSAACVRLFPGHGFGCRSACLLGFACNKKVWRVACRAGRRTELLVDGDSHSHRDILQAVELLQQERRSVKVTVFGPPEGRRNRKEWQQLLRAPNITFRPVAREQDARGEATDEAICLTIQSLRSNADVDCIALLSTDKGFARPLQECKVSGTRAVVFIPESKKVVIDFYEANNLRVQQLPVVQTCPKVRALLYANGSGTVKLAEPFAELYDEGRTEAVKEFLKSQGHLLGKDAYWIQPLAKFWFANALGTLPVFPAQLALSAMSKVISSASSSQSWHFDDRQLAFCIPISSQGRRTGQVSQFGSRAARSVFRGGGPFMLRDSARLIPRVLTKLGYLDKNLNADLAEAMLCFVNTSANKHVLRKQGFLPSKLATVQETGSSLRRAFLSNRFAATWQIGPRSTPEIEQLLKAARALPEGTWSREELFSAMQLYARRHKLPKMKTFNGLAWRILRSKETNPTRRGDIEITR
ncbi:unnamed protein product [Effrenium voratum]|nr:unnamed protein product [Effrenium voratum]